jgi:hypothetical protein
LGGSSLQVVAELELELELLEPDAAMACAVVRSLSFDLFSLLF